MQSTEDNGSKEVDNARRRRALLPTACRLLPSASIAFIARLVAAYLPDPLSNSRQHEP